MSEPPLISVVIPTFNRFLATCRAVDSVLAQTLAELEVIVVDDSSTDDSPLRLAARYRDEARVRLVRTARNSGGGTARNLGADLAKGRYLAFLDSDDVWRPEKLATQLERHRHEAAQSSAPLLIYAASTVEYPDRGRNVRPDRPLRPGERIEEYLFCDEQDIQTSGWFLTMADFQRVRFTEGQRRHQDLDLCLRAQAAGFRFVMTPQPLYARMHGADLVHVGKIRDDGLSSAWIERMKPLMTRRAYHHFRLFNILPAVYGSNAALCRRLCGDALREGRIVMLAQAGWHLLKLQSRARRQRAVSRLKAWLPGATAPPHATAPATRFYSTIWCKERPGFDERFVVLNRYEDGLWSVVKGIRRIRPGDAILLNGALGARDRFIDLWFGVYLRFFRKGVTLLISDATWHPRTVPQESKARFLFPLYSALQKRLLLLCESPRTHYCFLSRDEVDTFAQETGIDARRVHFTKFCSQLPLEILDQLEAAANETPAAPVVFAGGNSLRDYDTLIAAADGGVGAQVLIASSNRHQHDPAKVTFQYLSHEDFFLAMARSRIVVVPLVPTRKRSVGQQTYLNAMALGKLLIVSDVSGVRDHLVPGEHALVVPPQDPQALREAIRWALAPENAQRVHEIEQRGHAMAEQMTFAHYCRRLSDLLVRIAQAEDAFDMPTPSTTAARSGS